MKFLLCFFLLTGLAHAEDGIKKVVYDLTSGDIKVFERKVLSGIANSKSHYESQLEELEATVVIHGGAYKFFIEDLINSPFKNESDLNKAHKDLAKRLSAMSEIYDIEFLMCEIGMRKLKIDEKSLYKFVKLVPNSTIGLIDKQNEGSAYIPISK
ncbi:MAG: DsrE family protein [Campylobacterota bacterium]|nr:DsrE family protein [Campylobacterota bacterium]